MACSDCRSGLLLTVNSTSWILGKVRDGGYPKHMLGLQPVVKGLPEFLGLRYNVHYIVDIDRFQEQSLQYIELTLLREGHIITPCPHNPFTPDIDNLTVEQNWIHNLGFNLD